MELLVGSGSRREKLIYTNNKKEWNHLITLDINPDHNPDVVFDLNNFPYPFDDNIFDEIHAYEVLEHISTQGDYKHFFKEFSEYWRILKPGGKFFGSSPALDSVWLWGDPSHTRVISQETLTFLSQKNYEEQVGYTPMSDFRSIYKADFSLDYANIKDYSFYFVLTKC